MALVGNNRGDEPRAVTNCADYLSAVNQGFFPDTTLGAKLVSNFVECYVLRDLKHVKPSRVSFVPHEWSRDTLTLLPLLMETGIEGRELSNASVSWADTIPGSKLTTIDRDTVVIEDDTYLYGLKILAWGDLNEDTFEDLAVAGEIGIKGATYFHTQYFVLTRCQGRGLLRTVTARLRPYGLGSARCP